MASASERLGERGSFFFGTSLSGELSTS